MSAVQCVVLLMASCAVLAANADGVDKVFSFPHSKSAVCAENWLIMEKMLADRNLQCREVRKIDGFPYLRGNRQLLEMADGLHGKYAEHEWLELLRRVDLQARYRELMRLPDDRLASLCQSVGMECSEGRIKAWAARCSAMIMGDEKRNHDFISLLKKMAKSAAGMPLQDAGMRCFEDPATLDGLVPADVSGLVSGAGKKSVGSRLDQRVQGIKSRSMPYKFR